MEQMTVEQIVLEMFGEDPLALANKSMDEMSKGELKKLALLSCNKVGELLKQLEEPTMTNQEDLPIMDFLYFMKGVKHVFTSLEVAKFNIIAEKFNTQGEGNA